MGQFVRSIAVLTLIAMVGGSSPGFAGGKLAGPIDGLQIELGALRARVDRAPGATSYDLDRARRELAQQQLERPDDPRLLRLGQQIRDLQWQADRGLRAAAGAADRARLEAGPGALGAPGVLGPLERGDLRGDLRGDRLPIGTGKRFILIQNGLRTAEAELGRGRVTAAATEVVGAKRELAALRAELGPALAAADPNLVAVQADVTALEHRIDAGRSAALAPWSAPLLAGERRAGSRGAQ